MSKQKIPSHTSEQKPYFKKDGRGRPSLQKHKNPHNKPSTDSSFDCRSLSVGASQPKISNKRSERAHAPSWEDSPNRLQERRSLSVGASRPPSWEDSPNRLQERRSLPVGASRPKVSNKRSERAHAPSWEDSPKQLQERRSLPVGASRP